MAISSLEVAPDCAASVAPVLRRPWRRGDRVDIATPSEAGSTGVGKHMTGYIRPTSCTEAAPAHAIGTDWAEAWTESRPAANALSAFTAATSDLNTKFKYLGAMAYDSTLGKPLFYKGNLTTSVWVDATGTTVHTPL